MLCTHYNIYWLFCYLFLLQHMKLDKNEPTFSYYLLFWIAVGKCYQFKDRDSNHLQSDLKFINVQVSWTKNHCSAHQMKRINNFKQPIHKNYRFKKCVLCHLKVVMALPLLGLDYFLNLFLNLRIAFIENKSLHFVDI